MPLLRANYSNLIHISSQEWAGIAIALGKMLRSRATSHPFDMLTVPSFLCEIAMFGLVPRGITTNTTGFVGLKWRHHVETEVSGACVGRPL